MEAGHQDTVVQALKTALSKSGWRPDQAREKAAKRNLKETTPDRVAAAMAVKKPGEKKRFESRPAERKKFDAKPAAKGKRKSWT